MKNILLFMAITMLAMVISCTSKKTEEPHSGSKTAGKKIQFRVEESMYADMDDAPVNSKVETVNGTTFIVIAYNPKYIKPVVGYPSHEVIAVTGYPASAASYALQDDRYSSACTNQALLILSKADTYYLQPDGVCDYIRDLRKLMNECPSVSGQLEPSIRQLSMFTNCN